MSEHQPPEPSATYTYAVGAGLGLLVGGAVGLFAGDDLFLPAALLGAGIGVVVSFLVKAFLR
ncbi:MAG: hypothetical protein QOH68_855 [Nocardioidaceae bacterium]|jgi:hypothetical protein|nr:hypothetical protein [Nocardioidaceae bacterium]